MKSKASFIVFFLLFYSQCFSQHSNNPVSILFYNVENLFDTYDNPNTNDNEFTPSGERHWTSKRLDKKLLNISKVILNAAGWSVPDIIGLCEVENRYVLERLLSETPLKKYSFKIIHKESPDHRGIDVALLYNSKTFAPLSYKFYPLKSGDGSIKKTREILYVSGVVNSADTVYVFFNHWPSRYSGLLETQPARAAAAKLLRLKVDEIFRKHKSPKIIIMGDFNDRPTDKSVSDVLGAKKIGGTINGKKLYNLSLAWQNDGHGTLKYHSQWSVFDQIIVSGYLLNATPGYIAKPQKAEIVNIPFLLMKDEKFGGVKPRRTYYGYSYEGGFSDHLPVQLTLELVR